MKVINDIESNAELESATLTFKRKDGVKASITVYDEDIMRFLSEELCLDRNLQIVEVDHPDGTKHNVVTQIDHIKRTEEGDEICYVCGMSPHDNLF